MDNQKGERPHLRKKKSHWWMGQGKLDRINVKIKEVAEGSSMEAYPGESAHYRRDH